MTPERILELKVISKHQGNYPERVIGDCLDECVDAIERMQAELKATEGQRVPQYDVELREARLLVESLQAENERLRGQGHRRERNGMTDSFGHLETVLIDVAYVKHLQAEVERLKAELKNDADEFEHLHEYWNGRQSSAVDACHHLFERCEAAIERLRAIVEKGQNET